MEPITYRPIEAGDFGHVKRMIDEAFYIHKYAPTPRLLASALEVYLRQCLLASSFTQVAVMDGRAVGVLMGRVQGEPRLPGRPANRVRLAAHFATLAATGFPQRKTLLQFFSFNRAYGKLRAATHAPLTDELTLFAVDASTRGLGVGKTLYENFMEHLRSHGRTDFFLYTDSLCTYQFYEKRGMERAAEESLPITLDGIAGDVDVYLYTGDVPS